MKNAWSGEISRNECSFSKVSGELRSASPQTLVLAYPTSVTEEILYVEVYIMGYIPE